ncbi:Threonine dehydrogenase and related Zn-dependent dehydrogenase [Rubrobacter radiotolerans]|uniref:Threonine dehydrogenase and related Zn-dependent dehydrogenase n=1 Tax=Rubrobacter radiotolerans TaxID=42256 RepID=A0A023X2A6_RUBRA|nr:alcohol dehydrogenase catalytic domain-containing protein [Rubrobacter radiotolerans]AHY46356.1 Threonine dehydrogenase and related Zn-dependent dehydrogenase [Rubrobacter radiotolerans]
MRAFVKFGTQAGEAGVREIAPPEPGPGEALLRVAACGICGSDVHAFNADPGFEWVKPPITLGHEFSGTVESVGSDVSGVEPGDRVVAVAIQGCGLCDLCAEGSTQLCAERVALGLSRDGGMAGYTSVPAKGLVPVPEDLDLKTAALGEPLAVAGRAVGVRGEVREGQSVVVSGPGPIGVMCAMLARSRRAEVLLTGVGPDTEARLPAAERAGIPTANLSDAPLEDHLRRRFGERGPEVWIESSGSVRALDSAIKAVRPGGRVVVVGLYAQKMAFFPTDSVRREIGLVFSYSCNLADYTAALGALASGDLDPAPMLSEFPLTDASAAFEEVRRGRAVKALLVP